MGGENRSFRLRALVAFALVYVFWGSTYLAIGIAVKHIPPVVLGAARFIIAGALMLAWCALRGKQVRLRRRELVRLGMIGVLLLTTGNVVLGLAETYIPTGLAALLGAVTPLCFVLLERLSDRGERIGWRGLAGILLGLLGVAVLLWPSLSVPLHVGCRELIGAALVLCCSFSWACGSVISKRSALGVDVYTATAWEMLLGGLFNLLLAVAVGDLTAGTWTREAVWSVAYLIVAGSWIGFTAFVWLLHHVPTSKVSTHSYVNPIVAVLLGWLVLHERITGYIIAGSVIVVFSVILVTGAKRRAIVSASARTALKAAAPAEVVALAGVEAAADAVVVALGNSPPEDEASAKRFADEAAIRDKACLPTLGEQA
jgi:drug/metabolite transporter (DMT)-like permease